MKQTDIGILLNRISYSDSSLIVTYLTASSGGQKFIFRGGKKKAAGIFPLAISELNFYGRSGSELLNLTAVEPHVATSFQFDPMKSAVAFFIAEVIRKSTIDGLEDPASFSFVKETIENLDNAKNISLFPLEFLILFSEKLGHAPLIDDHGANYFNIDEGSFQMTDSNYQKCYSGPKVRLISELVLGVDISEHSKQDRVDALNIMLEYYKVHIPRFGDLESLEIVKEIIK